MLMARIALVMYVAFLAVAFGFRIWLQYRRMKDHGIRLRWSRSNKIERTGVLLLLFGAILSGVAPLAQIMALVMESRLMSTPGLSWIGLLPAFLGFTVTFVAQLQMRDSWRIGVDAREMTPLVTVGLFAHVRNPIFAGILIATIGFLLLVPNVLSVVALASLVLGIELQV